MSPPSSLPRLSGLVRFEDCELDYDALRLTQAGEPKALRRKTFDVLCLLVTRAGEVVSKDDLLDAVWVDATVGEDMPRICVGELRRCLGDDTRSPRFIETVHGRGYRFLPEVRLGTQSAGDQVPAAKPREGQALLVGRDDELLQLTELIEAARTGRRQFALVSGEAGIGKTSLVESALRSVENAPSNEPAFFLTEAQGRQRLGPDEAYVPWLEALAKICRDSVPAGAELAAKLLRRHAPLWAAQLPWLGGAEAREDLDRGVPSASRMFEELALFCEALSFHAPLILRFEDLHWCDAASLEALSFLLARSSPARLCVFATTRPLPPGNEETESYKSLLALEQDPRVQRLQLEPLTARSVAIYLEQRFAGLDYGHDLPRALQKRSGGNPFFLTSLLAEPGAGNSATAVDLESLVTPDAALPVGIDQMISRQTAVLPDQDVVLLEAASVIGLEFSSSVLAAVLDRDSKGVEEACDAMAAREFFLARCPSVPSTDTTGAKRFAFRHALYVQALYDRQALTLRKQRHLRIAEVLELACGSSLANTATELAFHFEHAGDGARAVLYLEQAALRASDRYADREAADLLARALRLLDGLPLEDGSLQSRCRMELARGMALAATRGYGAVDARTAYERASELATNIGDRELLCRALLGLRLSSGVRGTLGETYEISRRGADLARGLEDADLAGYAKAGLGVAHYYRGELEAARSTLRRDPKDPQPLHSTRKRIAFGLDENVERRAYSGWTLWALGQVDEGQRETEASLKIGQELQHPPTLAFAFSCASWVHLYRSELTLATTYADAALALAQEAELDYLTSGAHTLRAWILTEEQRYELALEEIEAGFAISVGNQGHVASSLFFARLAQIYAGLACNDQALDCLRNAESELRATGAMVLGPEVALLRGRTYRRWAEASPDAEQTLQHLDEARSSFDMAVDRAATIGACSWQLKALLDLAELEERAGGVRASTRARLHEARGAIQQGADTPDLRAATRFMANGGAS